MTTDRDSASPDLTDEQRLRCVAIAWDDSNVLVSDCAVIAMREGIAIGRQEAQPAAQPSASGAAVAVQECIRMVERRPGNPRGIGLAIVDMLDYLAKLKDAAPVQAPSDAQPVDDVAFKRGIEAAYSVVNAMYFAPKSYESVGEAFYAIMDALKAIAQSPPRDARPVDAHDADTCQYCDWTGRLLDGEPCMGAQPVDERAKRLYFKSTANDPLVHCNRFPAWSELSDAERREWRNRALAQPAPQEKKP